MFNQKRTRAQTKHLSRNQFQPDSGVVSALKSIQQNPKFARCISFAMSCLQPLLTPPNPRHRDNGAYIINQGAYKNLIQAIIDHIDNDGILYHATLLMIQLVGKDRFKDENIAMLIVDNGGTEALVKALNHPSEKSKDTINAITELINLLATNPFIAQKLIEQGVPEALLNLLQNQKLNEKTQKKVMDAMTKLSAHAQARTTLISRDIVPKMVNFLESKQNLSSAVVLSGLKFIENISRSVEGINYLKKNGQGMQLLVKIMDMYKIDKQILNIGSQVLAKIASVDDLDACLAKIQQNPEDAQVELTMLSQLILVDDLTEQLVKKGAVASLVALFNNSVKSVKSGNSKSLSPQQKQLICQCAVSLGRIAEIDSKQLKAVIEQGAIASLIDSLDVEDNQVVEAVLHTIEKLCQNEAALQQIIESGCVPKVLQAAQKFAGNPNIAKAAINLITTLTNNDEGIEQIAQGQGIQTLISLLQNNQDNKDIVINTTKAISSMIVDEEKAQVCIENGTVELIQNIAKQHSNWRKFAYQAANLLDILSEIETVIPQMKKSNGVEAIISLLTGQTYDVSKYEVQSEEQTQNEQDVQLNEEEGLDEDVLKSKQEQELQEIGRSVLQKLVTVDDIPDIKAQLVEAIKKFNQTPDIKNVKALEKEISTLSQILPIEDLGQPLLEQGIVDEFLDFASQVNKKKDFEGKNSLVQATIDMFNNLIKLNNNQKAKPLYQQKKIGSKFIDFINDILENNKEPHQVIQGLKALKGVLQQKSSDGDKNKKRQTIVESFDTKNPIQDKMIEGIIANMKKYADNEQVQLKALEVLNTLSQISPETNSELVKQGVTRIIISKLEDDFTTSKVGVGCMRLLDNIGTAKKDALVLMNNQKAVTAIMGFLAHHQNNQEIAEAAQPILKKLANTNNSDFSESLLEDVKELVQQIDPVVQGQDFDRKNAAESLDLLNNYTLIPKCIDPILKNGVVPALANLIQNEINQKENDLAQQGENKLNERLLNGATSLCNRLIESQQGLKSGVLGEIVKANIPALLIDTIQQKQHNKDVAKNAIVSTSNLLNNAKTKDAIVSQAEKQNVADTLVNILENNKDDRELTKATHNLLFGLTKESPKIANELGQKDFVKNLMKETKALLKNLEDPESLQLVDSNMQYLATLAHNTATANKIVQENGVEFALAVLKKASQGHSKYGDVQDKINSLNLDQNEDQQQQDDEVQDKDYHQEIIESTFDLLSKLIEQDPENAKQFINEENILAVLDNLTNVLGNKSLVEQTLNLLNQACKDNQNLVDILNQNEGVNKVLLAMNEYPTDHDILNEGGQLLETLGAASLISELTEQLSQLANSFDPSDDANKEELQKTYLKLANILAFQQDESDDNLESNKKIIKDLEKTLPKSLEDIPLLATQAVLISRLCNQGDETLKALKESKIPEIILKDIITNHNIMDPKNGKLAEIIMSSLNNMAGGSDELLAFVDENTGKDLQFSDDYKKENIGVFSDILLGGDGELLDELLEINELETEQPFSNETIQNNIEFLNKLCLMDKKLAENLVEKGAVRKLADLFENMSKKNLNKVGNKNAIKILGKLVGGLAQSKEGFDQLLKQTDLIPKIVDTINSVNINQDLTNRLEDQDLLNEGYDILKNICDNEFDKDKIIELKVPECLLDAIKRFNQIPNSAFKEDESLLQQLQKVTNALKKFVKDPQLARVVNKNGGAFVLQESLQKLNKIAAQANQGKGKAQVQQNDGNEIFGSDQALDRVIESTISALEELSSNPKNAEKIQLLEKVNPELPAMIETISDTLKEQLSDAYTTYNCLRAIENCLKPYSKQQIQEHQAELQPFVQLCSQVQTLYPNMEKIAQMTQEVTDVANGVLDPADIGKVQNKEEENQAQGQQAEQQVELELFTVDQVGSRLDDILDILEEFIKKVNRGEAVKPEEENQIANILDVLGEFAQQSSENAIKLHNMDITGSLVELANIKKYSPEIAMAATQVISKLSQDDKILDKMAEEDQLTALAANTLLDLIESSPLAQNLEKIAENVLETVYNMAENSALVENLITEGIIKSAIDLIKANKDKPDVVTKALEAIAMLAIDSDAIQEIIDLGGIELLNEMHDKYFDLLKFLRAYALMIGKMAVDEPTRIKFGESNVIERLINGIKKFPEDVILSSNTCFAMGNLVNNNAKNQNTVVQSEFMAQAKKMIVNMLENKDLIMNLCSFYNSVSFRNPQIKKELGKLGTMQDLKNVFDYYSNNFDEQNVDTLKQCFKAIGNIALFFENATLIIQEGFVQSASNFITKNFQQSELVRFTFDIFANLASYPEEANENNIKGIINQGAIPILIHSIEENELNSDLLLAAVNALEYLCRNKPVRNIVFESNGIPLVLKLLKSQDWNKEIVLRCLKILFNLAKDNVEILMQNKVPQSMTDIIIVQKSNDEILFPCLKILQKICIDKANCKVMYQYGLIQSLLDIFNQQISLESLQTLLNILFNMATFCEDASELICQKGIHHVFNTIQTRMSDQKTLLQAMILFEALLNLQGNIDIIIQNQGINLANTIIQKNPNHKDILLCTFKSLSVIALANEDNRIMCVDAKCVDFIQAVIDIKDQPQIVVGEGKLTINNINFKLSEIKDDPESSQRQIEKLITPEIRNFLISGKVVKMYRANGDRVEMHMFLDNGLKEIFAHKPKDKEIKPKWRMVIHQIKELIPEYGNNQTNLNKYNQSPFACHTGLFKKKPDPNLCFTILGPITSNGQKRFDIEASSLIEKKKWVECFKAVLESLRIQNKKLAQQS